MPPASIAAVKRVVDVALGDTTNALVAESNALTALMAAGNHVEPMRHFLAAGGQTRDGEPDDFAGGTDRTLGGWPGPRRVGSELAVRAARIDPTSVVSRPMTDIVASRSPFIDGAFVRGDGDSFTIIDPATEGVTAEVESASDDQVHAAIAAARRAFDDGPWPQMSTDER